MTAEVIGSDDLAPSVCPDKRRGAWQRFDCGDEPIPFSRNRDDVVVLVGSLAEHPAQ
jgi:hypothetical protein